MLNIGDSFETQTFDSIWNYENIGNIFAISINHFKNPLLTILIGFQRSQKVSKFKSIQICSFIYISETSDKQFRLWQIYPISIYHALRILSKVFRHKFRNTRASMPTEPILWIMLSWVWQVGFICIFYKARLWYSAVSTLEFFF